MKDQMLVDLYYYTIGRLLILTLKGKVSSSLNKKQKQSSQIFSRLGALKNFANFTRKHRLWSLFLKKFCAWRPFLTEPLPWMLLKRQTTLQSWNIFSYFDCPVDTGRKLNVYKTFRRRQGCLLNVSYTFN